MLTATLLLFLMQSISYGSDKTDRAEYIRISDTMMRLSKRKLWKGVSKRFSDLEELKYPITFEHWLIGAQAAQEIGNMELVRFRLRNAIKIKKKKHVDEWLNGIDENYGLVALKAHGSHNTLLQVVEWPLDPVKSNALKKAQEILQTDLEFHGLLPKGKYIFIDHEFTVQPGIDIQLHINPKQRRKGLKVPLITKPKNIFDNED